MAVDRCREFESQFIAREIDPGEMLSISVPVAILCSTTLISPLASTDQLGSLYTAETISLTSRLGPGLPARTAQQSLGEAHLETWHHHHPLRA